MATDLQVLQAAAKNHGVRLRRVRWEPATLIADQGQAIDEVHLLTTGLVDEWRSVYRLGVRERGHWLSVQHLWDEAPRSLSQACSRGRVTAVEVGLADLRRLVELDDELARRACRAAAAAAQV